MPLNTFTILFNWILIAKHYQFMIVCIFAYFCENTQYDARWFLHDA